MGFEGNALGDEATQAVQVDQMSKFQAIAKGAACSDDGISEAQGANLNTEVNAVRGTHAGERIARSSLSIRKILRSLWNYLDARVCRASARTRPSRVASVMPQSAARVGAMSAGVTALKYSPGWIPYPSKSSGTC